MAGKKVTLKKVTLAVLVAATLSEAGFMFASEAAVAELVKHGFAEVNPKVKNEAGEFGVRATQAGIDAHNNATAKAADTGYTADTADTGDTEAESEPVQSGFKIVDKAVPASASKRGRQAGASKYPFDRLQPGQSFFVGDKVSGMDDAYKGMASSVTGANKRYAEVIEGAKPVANRKGVLVAPTKQTRKFTQSRVEDGAEWGFPGMSGTVIGRVL